MDREKVIKALELCAEGHHCHECSYQPVKHNLDGIADCTSLLADHALELLKEQEAMNVDVFVQWCIDSHIMGDATVRGIKYWVGKYKEINKGR